MLVNIAFQGTDGGTAFPFIGAKRTEARPAAVGEDDAKPADVIDGLAVDDGTRPGGVVADHAAEVRAAGRGHVWTELQTVFGQGAIERIEDDTRLHADDARGGIDVENGVEVFAAIDNDAGADRLAGQAGSAAARRDWHLRLGRDLHGGDEILDTFGNDDAERLHLVNAGIGAVQTARGGIEAHFAGQVLAQMAAEVIALKFGGAVHGEAATYSIRAFAAVLANWKPPAIVRSCVLGVQDR